MRCIGELRIDIGAVDIEARNVATAWPPQLPMVAPPERWNRFQSLAKPVSAVAATSSASPLSLTLTTLFLSDRFELVLANLIAVPPD